MSSEELVGTLDIAMISEILVEPCYLSEVARKLQEANVPMGYDVGDLEDIEVIKNTWGDVNHNTALVGVMIVLSIVNEDEGRFTVTEEGYDVVDNSIKGQSQSTGSVHRSFVGEEADTEWQDYTIVHNEDIKESNVGSSLEQEGYNELASQLRSVVDPSLSVEDKLDMIKSLSRAGNDASRNAESILVDVMERQFREYDEFESSDYNDPGPDFKVRDEDRRNYGLIIEVSTRYVNPIGDPYVSRKIDLSLDLEEEEEVESQPWDIIIMAPNFTQKVEGRYEDPDDPSWHSNPESGMVHVHRVPSMRPDIYRPFATSPKDVERKGDFGNPIIVPDSEELRGHILEYGNIGDRYPIVDSDYEEFVNNLDEVFRDYIVVTESRYRNMLRESIEPLLWEFMRPYKIEQFLIDMYWDKGLTQSGIGKLVDRSGSTIGRWMREWGVIRRGTGAPELTEEIREVWGRMYEGRDPFPEQFSGYRIQAEYNRHPLWGLDEWRDWYQNTTEEERKEVMRTQDTFRDNLDYTILVGDTNRLVPSYTFILQTLRDRGIDIREPDEAPRTPYSAYASRESIEYMLNKDQNTIVDVTGDDNE